MDVGKRLISIREKFSYTQEKVAEETGIAASALSDFENNKRLPNLNQLQVLADFFRLSLSSFLEEEEMKAETLVLWRHQPESPVRETLEAEFRELCRYYTNLEDWTKNHTPNSFKNLLVAEPIESFSEAEKLAAQMLKTMTLGDYPGLTLRKVLEEEYDVKIFHLDLQDKGVAACSYGDVSGAAIYLNLNNKKWRRNFDLAHELFHLLTWKVRRSSSDSAGEPHDEKLANRFAGCLLMPEQKTREAIKLAQNSDGKISIEKFDDIARKFDVSLEALSRQMKVLFNFADEKVNEILEQVKQYKEPREDVQAVHYPERYKYLAQQALRCGEISTNRFLKYLKYDRLSRKNINEILSSHVPNPIALPPASNS
jgi:Zn-dependent peptidase ImmA (M78 family)/transcriptional regulator with XRE-family HTH domain